MYLHPFLHYYQPTLTEMIWSSYTHTKQSDASMELKSMSKLTNEHGRIPNAFWDLNVNNSPQKYFFNAQAKCFLSHNKRF